MAREMGEGLIKALPWPELAEIRLTQKLPGFFPHGCWAVVATQLHIIIATILLSNCSSKENGSPKP